MASRHLTLDESDLLQKSNVSPLRRGFETAAGPLILLIRLGKDGEPEVINQLFQRMRFY